MPAPENTSALPFAFAAFDRALDQFQRGRPVQPHAALRGVHRLGDAEAEIPDVLAKRDGPVPVDRGRQPRIVIGERIGHHMRRRERHAVQRALELCRKRPRRREAIGLEPTSAVGSFSDSDDTGRTGLFMAWLLTP